MASSSKTPNLNLPQWTATEKPERTDFNDAFDAIDGLVVSGSNTNGSYVKFPDGTMICTGASANQTLEFEWTYPQPFIANPIISVLPAFSSDLATNVTLYQRSKTSSSVTLKAYGTSTPYIMATAIGRWKA